MNPVPLRRLLLLCLVAALAAAAPVARAQTAVLTYLHGYEYPEGYRPNGELIQGRDGNFYGTAEGGGANSVGTVFRLTPGGALTVLHDFNGQSGEGGSPLAGVVQGADGNFYGTTITGGTYGNGTAYQLTPAGALTTIHSFQSFSGADDLPIKGLIQGRDGNFYGTTNTYGSDQLGTVYRLTPSGAFTVLHRFSSQHGTAGHPWSRLTQGSDGNFYGTTGTNGTGQPGTVFQITPAGVFTVLHTFAAADGHSGGLVQGSDGAFYGATADESYLSADHANHGVVYRLTSAGVYTVLYAFAGTRNDTGTGGGLALGRDGNLYGATQAFLADPGALFQVTPSGAYTLLYRFTRHSEGSGPSTPVQGSDGSFYGTLEDYGGAGGGTAFRLTLTSDVPVPTATLSALVPQATAGGKQPGVFLITLSSAPASDLRVRFGVGGSAVPGKDYLYPPPAFSTVIKAGRTRKRIQIAPEGNLGGAAKKAVKLTLEAGVGYRVGTPSPVKVRIVSGK